MSVYNIDLQGFVPEFAQTVITADDNEQAEYFAKEYMQENYPDWVDGEIVRIVEV